MAPEETANAYMRRMLAAIHPEDRSVWLDLFGGSLAGPKEAEYRILRADGETRWVRVRTFPLLDSSGNPRHIAGVTEDITARKRAEAELERYNRLRERIAQFSAEFLQLSSERIDKAFVVALATIAEVVEAVVAGMWLFDESGSTLRLRWHWHQPGFPAPSRDVFELQAFAMSPELDRGATATRSISGLPDAWAAARAAFAADGLRSSLAAPLMAGGKLLGVLTFASTQERTWPDELSSLVRIAGGMFANVIDRARAEQATRAHRDQLAHVLRLKTMGQLASGIAHELNQPLGAILSYARGCIRRIDAGSTDVDEMRDVFERVGEQAVRAGEVIRVLRALVKAETHRTRHDIDHLLRDALGLLAPEIARIGVAIEIDAADAPPVHVDPIQIEQVVLNLLRNACDALAEVPEAERTIAVAAVQHGAKHLLVSIRDHGPGIGREQAERIFDDFFTSKTEGLGLGLPISRSIIEAHGGRIWLDPSVSPGACFRFTVPLAGGAS